MKPLTLDQLIGYAEYEQQREAYRRDMIALKQARRISVGPKITLIFENRDTVQFQIQEMIRAERIIDPLKVQDELDVYNALLPSAGELSATLFIEITDSSDIKRDLDALQGLDRGQAVTLVAGDVEVAGAFEGGHSNDVKISAVHFIRFRPSEEFIAALRQADSPASIRIEHASYRAGATVPETLRQAWLEDLSQP